MPMIILESINNLIPIFNWLIRWLKKRKFRNIDLQYIKENAHVLFIDDKSFDIIDRIREAGWMVDSVKDIKSTDDDKVKRSHVIFVDFKGVGKYLSPSEEGIGLVKNLKKKYPHKRIGFYSAHTEFSLADKYWEIADFILPKNSEPYVFIEKIEENARITLSS